MKLFEDAFGAFGLNVLAGFSFDILLHEIYVTKTDDATISAAMYMKLASKPGFQLGML